MAGLLDWSNSIRFIMANDPGRKLFQDQINDHGFVFLNNYLDNILSGPRHDPLIELVKTPGRKKAVSKTKAFGPFKLQAMEDREILRDIPAPTNTLHGLQSKIEDRKSAQVPQPSGIVRDHDPPVPENALSAPCTGESDAVLLAPIRVDQNDLSVIAEDDENAESSSLTQQQSNANISSPAYQYSAKHDRTDVQVSQTLSPSLPLPSLDPQKTSILESSSGSFHSINLDCHLTDEDSNRKDKSPPVLTSNHAPPELLVEKILEANDLRRLAPAMLSSSAHDENEDQAAISTMSIPSVTPNTLLDQGGDIPLQDPHHPVVSPKGGEKFGVPLFPTLPAPMPLRKSIRVPRDPSVGTGTLCAATPGVPPGGKRTSWLKKAREANALEVTGKHIAVHVSPFDMLNPLKRKSDEMGFVTPTTQQVDGERRIKSTKIHHEVIPPFTTKSEPLHQLSPPHAPSPVQHSSTGQEGMLDLLKRTVEGLGAKVGRNLGRSPGAATVVGTNTVVSALAEARAAAEARVAERHKDAEEMTGVLSLVPTVPSVATLEVSATVPVERRLSVSDLFPPKDGGTKMKNKSIIPFQFITHAVETAANDCIIPNLGSTTTTPPTSPTITRTQKFPFPSAPVFNRPSPVFIPPVQSDKPSPNPAMDRKCMNSLSIEPTAALEIPVHPSSPLASKPLESLSKQTTLESIRSEVIFDNMDVLAWVPNTQDTEYSSGIGSQTQNLHQNALDEDDSWPVDEKLAAGVQWTFGHVKEDSLTWSTLPSQSQSADTGPLGTYEDYDRHANKPSTYGIVPGAFDANPDDDQGEDDRLVQVEKQCENAVCETTTNNFVEQTERSETQAMMLGLQSSQPNTGFLSQASKLLNSALGSNKKGKPEVKKVLQMAAVAAKKQQEENDKKAARLRDMENRRQLANQRKANEEKARAFEHERKLKDEGERRKREREETTEKRPLKTAVKKEEDTTKKRKVMIADGDKKELRKPTSKALYKSSLKPPSVLTTSVAFNAPLQSTSTTPKPADFKMPKIPSGITTQKGKGVLKQPPVDDDLSQPSQLVQVQMAARVKAQLQAAATPAPEPLVASESIELPEINSEYSDSEDEDRPKSFPEWAQSPELREALQVQSTINPDDIFGAVRPLRMEELFKTRATKFRARTSSANWTGTDRLTIEEEREYVRRMGYK